MSENGRIRKSVKNMGSGVVYRGIMMLCSFAVRTVFLKSLSTAYLGVNGLYSSILAMLSLAELGFGTAMSYSMYAPLASKDYKKLTQLMQLYKQVYRIIGTVIMGLGLSLIPFMDYIIKNKPDVPLLTFYYILFLMDTVMSYWFFAYRTSVYHADQKAYVLSNYDSVLQVIRSLLQIVVLLCFHNYTLYLVTQIGCTIIKNIIVAKRAQKEYPIFDGKKEDKLPIFEKKKIFNDVKALMLQKISFKVLNTSDSIIISAFVGVDWVGLLSNYWMITEAVLGVISQGVSAITASLGNYFAENSRESGYSMFKNIEFFNFWIYTFSSISLLVLLNPFIELWIGSKYVLSSFMVIALSIRFFVEGYMNIMSAFRSTMGLFVQGKYLPVVVALLNIVLSIILSYPLGAAGVIIATPIARCAINVWYMPLVIHKSGFNRSPKPFYFSYIFRICIIIGISIVMKIIANSLLGAGVTLLKFILLMFLVAIIPNVVMVFIYGKTEEFSYFYGIAKRILNKFK